MTMVFDSMRARGLISFINFLQVLQDTSHGWLADDIYGTSVISENDINSGEKGSMPLRIYIQKYYSDILPIATENEPNERNREKVTPVRHRCFLYPAFPVMYADPRAIGDRQDVEGHRDADRRPAFIYTHRRPKRLNNLDDPDDIQDCHQDPPFQHAAGQLKSIEQAFERESASTDQSMTLLKQEELTIRTLLQQNVQEQQELVHKKEVLSDLEQKLKEINIRANNMYTEPTEELSRARIRHLKRIPHRYDHHHENRNDFYERM